jgi:hypothetical protein
MPRRRTERSTAAVSSDLFHRQINRVASHHKSRADSHTAAKLIERDATRRRRIKREDSQQDAKNRSRRFDFEAKDLKGGEVSANSRTGEAEGVRGQAGSQNSVPGKIILQCTSYIVQYLNDENKVEKTCLKRTINYEEISFKVICENLSPHFLFFMK